jgi:hypothetical protein
VSTTEEAPKKSKAEAQVETQAEVEEQSLPLTRYITVSVDIEVSVSSDEVTAEQVADAAREQVTLPNLLWVGISNGQAAATVLGATGTGVVDSGEQVASWEAGFGREASPEEEETKK